MLGLRFFCRPLEKCQLLKLMGPCSLPLSLCSVHLLLSSELTDGSTNHPIFAENLLWFRQGANPFMYFILFTFQRTLLVATILMPTSQRGNRLTEGCCLQAPWQKFTIFVSYSCITGYHKLGSLKQQNCILSQFWRLESTIGVVAEICSL